MDFIDLKTQYQKIKEPVNQRIQNVLDHGQYINGPEVRDLESALSEYVGVKETVACSSGTDALLLPMLALGIGQGDEVIVPAFTFYATAEMPSLVGAKVVFADINPKTYLIDVQDVAKKITNKTKAIVAVGLYGQCAQMEQLQKLADEHNLYLFEDAAQSFGATRLQKRSGSFGHAAATSFFPAKPLGCYGDGGAVFTNDAHLAQAMRELREHGSERRYYHTRVGINGRMDSMQAGILLEKLAIFDEEVKAREEIGHYYLQKLSPRYQCMEIEKGNTCVFAQFTIEVGDRDQLSALLKEKSIPTSIHYPMALNRQPVYSQDYGHLSFEHSERAAARVISLPMHPYLDRKDQDFIIESLLSL